MARDRTKDEILDQLVYAVACVARHYGPGLNAEGLNDIRDKLSQDNWWCDAEWLTCVLEGDGEPDPDFCPMMLRDGYSRLDFAETTRKSRTGKDE